MSNPELYMKARLSPNSLRYYGLCLQKGNYTVRLHFAEIIFTSDRTFSSVGKRMFDVPIQAYVLEQKGSLLDLVDPSLGSNYSKKEALQMLNLAHVCTSQPPTLRPQMSTTVSMIEGKTPVQVPSVMCTASRSEDMRSNRVKSISMDEPLADSSISVHGREEEAWHSVVTRLLSDHTELSLTVRSKSMPLDGRRCGS